MRCHIERDPMSDGHKLWLLDTDGPGPRSLYLPGRRPGDAERARINENVDAGQEPSLWLPDDALDAIVRAATDVRPPTDATSEHLRDAITVRDRLLTMIEGRR